MGVIMRQTKDEDNQGTLYGFLPKMAMSSEGGIRSLMASSFYERINSCANLVLTEGNTWLSDEEMGKLVMLRMNKRFMAFMMKYLLPVTTLSAVSSRLSLGFLSLPCLPFLLVCHLSSPSPFSTLLPSLLRDNPRKVIGAFRPSPTSWSLEEHM